MGIVIKTTMLILGSTVAGIGMYYHMDSLFIVGHIWLVGSIVFKAD